MPTRVPARRGVDSAMHVPFGVVPLVSAPDDGGRPARRGSAAFTVGLSLLLSACRAPAPAAGLRYEARPVTGWTAAGDGRWTTTAFGAAIAVELPPREPRVELSIDNPTAQRLTVRLGPEVTRTPSAAIGEVQFRLRDRARAEGATDYLPYVSMQPVALDAGHRAAFYLDSPIGRDPAIGQYFVLVVELQTPAGERQRHLLPLCATNVPAGRR